MTEECVSSCPCCGTARDATLNFIKIIEQQDKRIAVLESLIKDNLESETPFETDWNKEARRLLGISKEDSWEKDNE